MNYDGYNASRDTYDYDVVREQELEEQRKTAARDALRERKQSSGPKSSDYYEDQWRELQRRKEKERNRNTPESIERQNKFTEMKIRSEEEIEHRLEAIAAAKKRYREKSAFYRLFHRELISSSVKGLENMRYVSAKDMSTEEIENLYTGRKR